MAWLPIRSWASHGSSEPTQAAGSTAWRTASSTRSNSTDVEVSPVTPIRAPASPASDRSENTRTLRAPVGQPMP
jgi:hypothetical protein